eukprot:gene7833-16024_t
MTSRFILAMNVAIFAGAFFQTKTLPRRASSLLSKMVAQEEKPLQKVEAIKQRSNYLRDPLKEELENDEIFVGQDAVVVLKYHGSYMQDNRDNRKRGAEKDYSFMLRLKSPCGIIPPELYLKLDEISDKLGQGDLRATTRQAWQIHGILKGNLKTVISTIMEAGSSTVGACGDVSRNVMCSPAPFKSPAYEYARTYSKVMAELFKPQSAAFTELWQGEDKVVEMEYWMKDLNAQGFDIQTAMMKDTGHGIITKDAVEPLYGQRYLPRKFKIAVTVPGDNSVDIYINDIGLVVITNASGELEGFNVMVGGGMGRTHNKDSTFARTADHLGFVAKDDVMELCKSILAAQRDHGNREVRLNARMKYLVHERGIDAFRQLVETYFGKPISPWREIVEWRYEDWMGWHEQGDGKLFVGVNIEQGRVKDTDGLRIKAALKKIVTEFNIPMILSPTQSIIFSDIKPESKPAIEAILEEHGIKPIEKVDPLVRLSIACPALPLCGLAVTEAERRMPTWMANMRVLMNKLGLQGEEIMMRMTGCPNGCARPYMAELALVGDGPEMYQIWLGGSPLLTRVGTTYRNKQKWVEMDKILEPILVFWKNQRKSGESFGDFTHRVGNEAIEAFTASYQ